MKVRVGLVEIMLCAGCFIYASNFWLSLFLIITACIAGVVRYSVELGHNSELMALENKKVDSYKEASESLASLGVFSQPYSDTQIQ